VGNNNDSKGDQRDRERGRQQLGYNRLGISYWQGTPEKNALVLAFGIQRIETVKDRQDPSCDKKGHCIANQNSEERRTTLGVASQILCAHNADIHYLLISGGKHESGQQG